MKANISTGDSESAQVRAGDRRASSAVSRAGCRGIRALITGDVYDGGGAGIDDYCDHCSHQGPQVGTEEGMKLAPNDSGEQVVRPIYLKRDGRLRRDQIEKCIARNI